MGPSSTQVCMDYSDCPQDKDVKVSMEGGLLADRKGKPHPEQALKCPRCDSANTKFCYYNNYSLSQPRYFCKTCRRYWTKGGTLRNVPVGGGCRKNKRPKRSSEETSCASAASASDHTSNEITGLMEKDNNNNIPSISGSIYYGNDINMSFARFQEPGRLGADESAFKSSGAPDFLGMAYDGVGVDSMKSCGFPGMDFLKSLRNEHGDVNCLLEPQLQLAEAGGLPNLAPSAGLNSLMYPETYWRCHEQEQKVEPVVKEVSTEQLLLNFGEQTAENSRRQPKPEVFTSFGFSHGLEKEWQEQLEATRNSMYWNNGGAGTGTVWPFYGSSSVSPLN